MMGKLPIAYVPLGIRELIRAALDNPQTRPDHLLLLADWIDDFAANMARDSPCIENTKKCAAALRDHAPSLPPVTD